MKIPFNLDQFNGCKFYGCHNLKDLDFELTGTEEIDIVNLRDEEDCTLNIMHRIPIGPMFFAIFSKDKQRYTEVFKDAKDLHNWINEQLDEIRGVKKDPVKKEVKLSINTEESMYSNIVNNDRKLDDMLTIL